MSFNNEYRNDSMFSDGQVLANSADPYQTAPRLQYSLQRFVPMIL